MSCDTAREEIMLALYGELGAEALFELQTHTQRCEACRAEWEQLEAFHGSLHSHHAVAEPSPNLLAASRMRLDEALDAAPGRTAFERLMAHGLRWFGYVKSAPALATLLVGIGFLSGDFLARYKAEHAAKVPGSIILSGQGAVSSVSGVSPLPNSDLVRVSYNRVIPEEVQGSLDDPEIRKLLMLGTKLASDPAVHDDSIAYLMKGCEASHTCGAEGEYRGALLSTLKSDRNATVRLKALEGLRPYVSDDEQVRDGVLEALMRDKSPEVRTRAINVLAPVGADASVRQVLRSVSSQDANPAIRNASFHALQGASDIE